MVTGGAGFIGSAVIRRLIAVGYGNIVNIDLLTYAGNVETLQIKLAILATVLSTRIFEIARPCRK